MSTFVLVHKNKFAKAVSILHLMWMGALIGSGSVLILSLILSTTWNRYVALSIAALSVTAVSQLLFLGCPLTTLEEALRNYGETNDHSWDPGSFVVGCIMRFVGVSPSIVAVVTMMWLLFAISTTLFISYQVS